MNETETWKNNQTPKLRVAEVNGSALIARFMQVKEMESYYDSYGSRKPCYWMSNGVYRTCTYSEPGLAINEFLRNAKYDLSWDWLMPVVEKICKLKTGDGKTYVEYPTPRTFGMINEETGQIMVRFNGFSLCQADTLIEATCLAVLEFVDLWFQADR